MFLVPGIASWGLLYFMPSYPSIHGCVRKYKGVHSLKIWPALTAQVLFKVQTVDRSEEPVLKFCGLSSLSCKVAKQSSPKLHVSKNFLIRWDLNRRPPAPTTDALDHLTAEVPSMFFFFVTFNLCWRWQHYFEFWGLDLDSKEDLNIPGFFSTPYLLSISLEKNSCEGDMIWNHMVISIRI